MRVTEILGPRKVIFDIKDKIVYPLGNRYGLVAKLIRKAYWRLTGRYIWGVYNYLIDYKSVIKK